MQSGINQNFDISFWNTIKSKDYEVRAEKGPPVTKLRLIFFIQDASELEHPLAPRLPSGYEFLLLESWWCPKYSSSAG